MFFIKLLRFLAGYAEFTCEGGFSERFVNLCFSSGIKLWDVRASGGKMSAKVSLISLKKLNIPAEKSGMTVKISARRGLPVIIYESRSRLALLCSSIASCCIVFVLSSAIWSVSVSGNESFTQKQILDIFASYGVKAGTFAKNINVDSVQQAVVSSNPDIIWCSVNIIGSRAFIEILEGVKKPDMYSDTEPSNIVAPSDGVLTMLEVYSGEGAVRTGSAVLKGGLLISGTVERPDKSVKFVAADGKIEVRRNDSLAAAVSSNDPIYSVRSVKTRSIISLFGFEIPLGISRDSDLKSRTESFPVADGAVMPVGIISDRYVFLQPCGFETDYGRLLLIAGYEYFKAEKSLVSSCGIESRELKYTFENGICAVEGCYVLSDRRIVRQKIERINSD